MSRIRKIWDIAPLVVGVVSLSDLKLQLRVEQDVLDNDPQIESCGLAAAAWVERITQRLMSPRTITLRMSDLPCGRHPVSLLGGPVQEVTSVTIDGADFPGCVAYGSGPAHLVPPADWPRPAEEGYPVVIEYTSGYPVVPPDLVQAIKIVMTDLFDRRASISTDPAHDAAMTAMRMIEPHRIFAW